ncbi:hypothetical protein ABK040_002191 [Willaertia magna]
MSQQHYCKRLFVDLSICTTNNEDEFYNNKNNYDSAADAFISITLLFQKLKLKLTSKKLIPINWKNLRLIQTISCNDPKDEVKETDTDYRYYFNDNSVFRSPYATVIDEENGLMYISDFGNEQIQCFTLNGHFQFKFKLQSTPHSILLEERTKTLLIGCSDNIIYRYSLNGKMLTNNEFNTKESQLKSPLGMTLDENDGLLYVCDTDCNKIQIFSLIDGKWLKSFGKEGSGNGEFNYPRGICLTLDKNLIIVDRDNKRLQLMEKDGTFIKSIENECMRLCYQCSIDKTNGDIYVSDYSSSEIHIFDAFGKLKTSFESNAPIGVTVDNLNGTVLTTDYIRNKIYIFK